jgi:DNA integrity scanning protein DisA with diadenylate cyclase activity
MNQAIKTLEQYSAWLKQDYSVAPERLPVPRLEHVCLAIDDAVTRLQASEAMADAVAKLMQSYYSGGININHLEDVIQSLEDYRK